MVRKLTRKQQKFVEAYIESGVGTQAAIQAYPNTTYDTQRIIASENLAKPHILSAIEKALPDELLHKVHMEGLWATKPVWKEVDGRMENVAEEADFSVRHKYLDTAYKLKGSYAPEKKAVLHIKQEPSEKIKNLANKLNTKR